MAQQYLNDLSDVKEHVVEDLIYSLHPIHNPFQNWLYYTLGSFYPETYNFLLPSQAKVWETCPPITSMERIGVNINCYHHKSLITEQNTSKGRGKMCKGRDKMCKGRGKMCKGCNCKFLKRGNDIIIILPNGKEVLW
jgi:hypothetical protein